MNDKLFFVDRSLGIRKDYSEFVHDVNSNQFLPRIDSDNDPYKLIVSLVAALVCDQDLAMSQRPRTGNEDAGSFLFPVRPKLQLTDLSQSILRSSSKIGLFTSGTTGRAKLIQHRIETLARSVRNAAHHKADVWGLTYHPASFAGLQVILQAICNDNPLVQLAGIEPTLVHDEIQRLGITHISATPTWLRLICSDGAEHNSVTHITSGGEIADRALVKQTRDTFPNAIFRNIYASTESGTVLLSEGDVFRVPEKLADKVKVEDGILAVHHSLLADSIQRTSLEGFHLTGDCVEVLSDEPLTFRFTARRTDWINVGGSKVNPHEIERLLVSMEGISDARVFGRKNSVTGNIVCCEIVRCGDELITPKDIRQRLEKVVEPFMIPRIFDFVESIDKTPTGKKNRSE